MPSPIEDLICTSCSRRVSGNPRGAAFGFRKFDCPKCQATVTYPLSAARRALYWLLLLVKLLLVAVILNTGGQFPIPALAGVVFLWALVQDSVVARNLREAEQRLAGERG